MTEEWRPVRDFPEYQVSTLGRVKRDEYILSQDKRNYFYVNLWQKNKGQRRLVHRLMGEAFLNNPENKPEIDHINRDSFDNRLENLRWVTRQENLVNRDDTIRGTSNTGEPNISYHSTRNTYQVDKIKNFKRICKTFKTLEEAIAFRDSLR